MNVNDIVQAGNRCVFYGRHSTDKQDMIKQIQSVEDFAKEYNVTVVKYYKDEGVSATKKPKSKRQQLNELLDDLAEDLFDFVAVETIDRISRDPVEADEIRNVFAATGKPIVITSTSPPTIDEAPGDVFGFLKSALAKFEVDQLRERTRAKAEAGVKKGEHQGGKAPFGYEYSSRLKSFKQIPEEITLVRKVFDLYLQGHGCSKIAQQLPPKSHRGKDWTRHKVENVVKNSKYAGLQTWGERANHMENKHKEKITIPLSGIDPIISQEEWERCCKLREKRTTRIVDAKFYNTDYLIRDFLICGHCKEKLKTVNQETKGGKSGHKLYLCKSNKCQKVRVKSVVLDILVRKRIRNELLNFDTSTLIRRINKSFNKDLEQLDRRLEIHENEINKHNKKIKEIDSKIYSLAPKGFNEKSQHLIESFTLYRIEFSNKVELLEKQCQEIEENKILINKVMSNKEFWLPILSAINKPTGNVANVEWRLLISEVVDSVKITNIRNSKDKFRVAINLKYDLPTVTLSYSETRESKNEQLSLF